MMIFSKRIRKERVEKMDNNTRKKAQMLKAEKEVKELLMTSKLARKSDQALFIMHWRKKARNVPFKLFFLCPNLFNGYSFKTIERCRRKIQNDNPELKDLYVAEKRLETQQIYEQYSLNM